MPILYRMLLYLFYDLIGHLVKESLMRMQLLQALYVGNN